MIVTHHGPMPGGGVSKRRTNTPGQGIEKPDEWPPYWAAWAYSVKFECNVLMTMSLTRLPTMTHFTMQSRSYTATRYYMKKRRVDIRGLFISRYTVFTVYRYIPSRNHGCFVLKDQLTFLLFIVVIMHFKVYTFFYFTCLTIVWVFG